MMFIEDNFIDKNKTDILTLIERKGPTTINETSKILKISKSSVQGNIKFLESLDIIKLKYVLRECKTKKCAQTLIFRGDQK